MILLNLGERLSRQPQGNLDLSEILPFCSLQCRFVAFQQRWFLLSAILARRREGWRRQPAHLPAARLVASFLCATAESRCVVSCTALLHGVAPSSTAGWAL